MAAPLACSSAMLSPPWFLFRVRARSVAEPRFSFMSLVLVDHPRPEVAVLTMNRPDRLNAMSMELVNELYDALVGVGDDNACRVVVLTGAGRAFSSGLDLKDYGVVPNI